MRACWDSALISQLHSIFITGLFKVIHKDSETSEEEKDRNQREQRRIKLREKADALLQDPALLHHAIKTVQALGVAGEECTIGLIHLAVRSRALPRPVNLEINSPSSSGKTYLVIQTLRLEALSAYYELTAGSEKSLIYADEPLTHRMLYVQEPEGLAQGVGAAALKSLVWEGRLKYDTVVSDGEGPIGKHIEKEGPTGLIVTTTRPLEEQVSNRMLRLEIDTSEQQTRRILDTIAEGVSGGAREPVDIESWRVLSSLLGEPTEVEIPYAGWLAQSVDTITLRIRRDFTQLLSLIAACAIEHRFQRLSGTNGHIIASLADYGIVHALAGDIFQNAQAEGITQADRETVGIVGDLYEENQTPVSQAQLRERLGLSKGAVSYRVNRVLALGYLTNSEQRKGRPSQLLPGIALPEKSPPIPSP